MRYEVVEFWGFKGTGPNTSTDFHIVDEHGRTRAVVHATAGGPEWQRKLRAERICQQLNEREGVV